jgi:hypothetical protein
MESNANMIDIKPKIGMNKQTNGKPKPSRRGWMGI